MKQKAFTPIFAENLRSNVSENIAKYNNSDYLWENEAKDADAIIELDFEEPDLSDMMDYADNSLAKNDFFGKQADRYGNFFSKRCRKMPRNARRNI